MFPFVGFRLRLGLFSGANLLLNSGRFVKTHLHVDTVSPLAAKASMDVATLWRRPLRALPS